MLKKLLGDLIIPNKYLPLHAEIEPKTQNCVSQQRSFPHLQGQDRRRPDGQRAGHRPQSGRGDSDLKPFMLE